MSETHEKEIIEGTVEDIRFRNEQNGYTVLSVGCDDDLITAVGVFSDISVGETVKLQGEWTYHTTFGRQFKVEAFERNMPATTEQLYNYLAAGAIKGIGRATAERIVDMFGEKAFDYLESNPEMLSKVKGISPEKAEKICASYRSQFAIRSITMTLESYGIGPRECLAAYKAFGGDVVGKVTENPYVLCLPEVGVPFDRVETIADNLPHRPNDSYRIKAGVEHILRHNLYVDGHTCIPRDKLLRVAAEFLNTNADTVDIMTDELCHENRLVSKVFTDKEYVFLIQAFRDEKSISDRIKVLLNFPPAGHSALDSEIEKIEKADNISYAEKQKLAIKTAVNKGILILTGGPGTGKTTTLKGILRLFQSEGLDISLAAPTGRAAKRMTELTGKEAKTIHRLLEVEWDEHDRPTFKRNIRNPLECEALILDELSMVDISLFASLLNALPLGCRLIMLGDSDQLPPVGPGNFLRDLITSHRVPTIQLTEIFRQAQQSDIVMNAHAVNAGEMPRPSGADGDFFIMKRADPASVIETVAQLCAQRLPKHYGFTPAQIQVLSPAKRHGSGTIPLNRRLQEALNPPSESKLEKRFGDTIFREGDRVMQVRNNYDIVWEKQGDDEQGTGVFNGDVGEIIRIFPQQECMVIRFDDRIATYTFDMLNELELAYAVTVHKSQGSEFDAVVLALSDGLPRKLLTRNILYTAITRAKRLLVIVGSQDVVAYMVNNNQKGRRYSALKARLRLAETQ